MNYKIILHQQDLPDNLELGRVVSIDTETMGLNLIRDRLCLLQIKGKDNNVHLVQFAKGNYHCPNLKRILEDKSVNKIFHYARFDLLAIYLYLDVLCENVFCTKIASKMVRTNTIKHGLKEICKEILGVDLKKEQQTSNWGSEELTEEQKVYASDDVIYLKEIKDYLVYRLEQENRMKLAQSCFDFLPTKIILDSLGWLEEDDIFNH